MNNNLNDVPYVYGTIYKDKFQVGDLVSFSDYQNTFNCDKEYGIILDIKADELGPKRLFYKAKIFSITQNAFKKIILMALKIEDPLT